MNTMWIWTIVNSLIPFLVLVTLIAIAWGSVHGLILYSKNQNDKKLLVLSATNLVFILLPIAGMVVMFVDDSYEGILDLVFIAPLIAMCISLYLFFSYLPKKYGEAKAFMIYSYAPITLFLLIVLWAWLGWTQSNPY